MNTLRICSLMILLGAFLHTEGYAQWIKGDSLCKGNVAFVESANGFIFAGNRSGLYRSSDHGLHWNKSDTGITMKDITAFGTLWSTLFAGTSNGGIFVSRDNGQSWKNASGGLRITNVTAFAHSPDKATGTPSLYACFHDTLFAGSVYCTSDTGAHWTSVSSGITNGDARSLIFRGSDLYAGTMGGVFHSTNGGTDWSPKNSGMTVPYVVTLAAIDSVLFAGTMTGGAFRSFDGGVSWAQINNGLTNTYVNDLAATPAGILFAGTGWSGVYFTADNGTQWKQVNSGLTTYQINALAVDGEQQYLFAATDDGVWFRPLSEMLTEISVNNELIPETMVLKQNYPNPFNPSTTIRYALSPTPSPTGRGEGVRVKLTIYDLLGRRVTTLVDEEQSHGWKEVTWNAVNVPSGMYVYTIQAGTFVEMKKMLLIK